MDVAHWVRNIMNNGNVLVAINNETFEGNARIVDEETDFKLVAEVTNRMGTIYNWNDGLIIEITHRAIY